MRVIARRLGAPYTLCEVLLDKFVLDQHLQRANRRQLKVTDEEHPVGGQLMGADPEQFGPAARRLVEAGFDVVDINFGCPVKKVLGRFRGGYLLSQPKTALEIVSRVRDVLPPQIPVTVKMRRGLDDSPQSADNFYTIFDGVFRIGAAAVTVHGRTVVQRYVGPSNWDVLAEVKRHAADRTVLGSGDLFSAESCVEMMKHTGVDGVSIARGAIGNPWIFQQVRDAAAGRPVRWPGLFEQREVLAEHFRLSEEMYGEKRSSRDDAEVRHQIRAVASPSPRRQAGVHRRGAAPGLAIRPRRAGMPRISPGERRRGKGSFPSAELPLSRIACSDE